MVFSGTEALIEELAIDLDYSLHAFDSTTIHLCLSLFPWAHFRKTKAAIKLHAFFVVSISPGKISKIFYHVQKLYTTDLY